MKETPNKTTVRNKLFISTEFPNHHALVKSFTSLEAAHDNCVRVLDLANFKQVCDVTVVESAVSALRIQTTSERNLLAAADVRSGIRVFDLERHKDGCLYEVSIPSVCTCTF